MRNIFKQAVIAASLTVAVAFGWRFAAFPAQTGESPFIPIYDSGTLARGGELVELDNEALDVLAILFADMPALSPGDRIRRTAGPDILVAVRQEGANRVFTVYPGVPTSVDREVAIVEIQNKAYYLEADTYRYLRQRLGGS